MNPLTFTWPNWFEIPFLQTKVSTLLQTNVTATNATVANITPTNIIETQKEKLITLSDHEPVISTIYVKKFI